MVDLLFLVIIRQPKYLGGAHVCVFGLFLYTHFSLWVFNIFFFCPNQQIKLIEGVVVLGLDAVKPCLNFSYQTNYFLSLYGLIFKLVSLFSLFSDSLTSFVVFVVYLGSISFCIFLFWCNFWFSFLVWFSF